MLESPHAVLPPLVRRVLRWCYRTTTAPNTKGKFNSGKAIHATYTTLQAVPTSGKALLRMSGLGLI